VLRVVRQLLFRIHANDFYTQFTSEVEPKLVSEIKSLLTEQFNVDEAVDIFPKIGDSIIIQLIADLQRGQHSTDIKLFGNANYRITFSVKSVVSDKWGLFANRSDTNAVDIIFKIGKRIQAFVETILKSTLPDISAIHGPVLFGQIYRAAVESNRLIQEKMGLVIDVIDVEEIDNPFSRKIELAIQELDDKIIATIREGDYEGKKLAESERGKLMAALTEQASGQVKQLNFPYSINLGAPEEINIHENNERPLSEQNNEHDENDIEDI
jgi:hypothetical protein